MGAPGKWGSGAVVSLLSLTFLITLYLGAGGKSIHQEQFNHASVKPKAKIKITWGILYIITSVRSLGEKQHMLQ